MDSKNFGVYQLAHQGCQLVANRVQPIHFFLTFHVEYGIHTWAQHAERPPFFSEDRVSTDLQEQDLAMLKRSRFKMPP